MSGRGGGGRGGRGGWRGRGRGGPMGPVAKDDEGNIIDSTPAGPPPMYPEVLLPEYPQITAKEELLLIRRHDLAQSLKKSPFVLESSKESKAMDIESSIERWSDKQAAASAAAIRRKRRREPLTSVVKLLPEYIPEELFSNTDKKFARFQDAYWRRAGKKEDIGGLHKLDQLAKAEAAGGDKAQDDEAPEQIEDVVDTDDEEEMEDDDYYKGFHVDDDEGYEDDFDDAGGDDGPVF